MHSPRAVKAPARAEEKAEQERRYVPECSGSGSCVGWVTPARRRATAPARRQLLDSETRVQLARALGHENASAIVDRSWVGQRDICSKSRVRQGSFPGSRGKRSTPVGVSGGPPATTQASASVASRVTQRRRPGFVFQEDVPRSMPFASRRLRLLACKAGTLGFASLYRFRRPPDAGARDHRHRSAWPERARPGSGARRVAHWTARNLLACGSVGALSPRG